MREKMLPESYKRADQLNFLCIVATELLGINTLKNFPSLLSGFDSIYATLQPDVRQALINIRLSGIAPNTLRELSLMIEKYVEHHRMRNRLKANGEEMEGSIDQRYVIHDDFTIKPMWTKFPPNDVNDAIQSLTSVIPIKPYPEIKIHEAMKPGEIIRADDQNFVISPLGFLPIDPKHYPHEPVCHAPGKIAWDDLVDIAKEFDDIDVQKGKQEKGDNSWYHRLYDENDKPKVDLLKNTGSILEKSSEIHLVGVKHLIGLPGSGKTTMLFLLAAYLHKNNYRACFLFPSIEVASGFIETLSHYGVDVALLSGQAKTSRHRHALNFATALSSNNGGFGVTRPSAMNFSTNCALGGFVSDEDANFPHHNPPCQEVRQGDPGKRRTKHQCGLSSICGYQYGERKLGESRLWAGHILSLDRKLSPLFSTENLHHYEYISRTFDLLIVDECDGAQSNLDERGTPIMRLVGDVESLWSALLTDIHQPAAGGRNAFFAKESYPVLIEMTGRFGRASERLLGRVSHLHKDIREANANKLHTANSIIWEMFADEEDPDIDKRNMMRHGLELLWDAAIKTVAFRNMTDIDDEASADQLDAIFKRAADYLSSTTTDVSEFYSKLMQALDLWERDGNDSAVIELAKVLRDAPNLTSPMKDEYFFSYSGFLVSVSLVVLQHFGLAPHLRLMNAQGFVRDSVFISRASRSLVSMIPESLAGRLSGIRYTVSEEGNIDISHVSFEGTPRLMPYLMSRLGNNEENMAVLLTSATSMLEQSPSYHINTGPDYVLKRPNAGSGWEDSRYTFMPVLDPRNGKPLRFSGAEFSKRDQILTSIVDELLKNDDFSKVSNAIEQNDIVNGVGRKAGFVVNSYDQCRLIYDHIHNNYPKWRQRVRYLSRAHIHGSLDEHAITTAEVESLGFDTSWDLLIFPMNAIGRGVNIVYQSGDRKNKAMIGSLFFLTRPHPRGDSLQLIQGLVARSSEIFNTKVFSNTHQAIDELVEAKAQTAKMVSYLLRQPLVSQRLGDFAEPFVANQIIIILQTIGRAMRGDCPAFVYFVDAAWAPKYAVNKIDDTTTSMLVMMQSILSKCINHPNLAYRECYENLYRTFYEPLTKMLNELDKE